MKQASDSIKDQQERDHKLYFIEDGDEGFSPEHNKFVIEQTIKKAEALQRQKQKDYAEGIAERADAVATYLRSRLAEGNTPIEKYFGKQTLAQLVGRRIQNKITQLRLHEKVHRKGVMPGIRNAYLPTDG